MIRFVIAAVLLACVSSPALPHDVPPRKQPNILWVVAEDISPWLSMYGDETVQTPTFQRMADEGVTLMKAFAPVPICSPTRSALMTGRWPTSDGVHNHRRSRDGKGRDAIYLPEGHLTLPEIFRQHGYQTFNIGKDDYNFVYDRSAMYSAGPAGVEGHIGELIGPEFDWTQLTRSDQPFFGQIQLRGGKVRGEREFSIDTSGVPMFPYYPDIPSMRQAIDDHYHSIANTDAELREIFDRLESTGEAENTAVFFISDHGMLMLRHKQFLYDGGTHVPIFISWPAGQRFLRSRGQYRDELVSLIDLSAAALEIAGIPIPDYFEARGLFGADYQPRNFLPFSRDRADYTFDQIRAVRTQDFKYIRHKFPETAYLLPSYRDAWPMAQDMRRMAAEGSLDLVQAAFMADHRPPEELYDLSADPHEIRNLAGDPAYAEKLAELSLLLDKWIRDTGDKGQVPETDTEVAAVVARWQDLCTDPICQRYVARYGREAPSGASGVIEDGK